MFNRSLHYQLLGWLLLPLLILILFSSWQIYSNAEASARSVTDQTLISSAHAIAEQIKVTDGFVQAVIPPSALEIFASGHQDRGVYRVVDPSGRLLAGYPDVPGPSKAAEGFEPRFFDAEFRGQAIRGVAIGQQLVGSSEHGVALVVVGRTLHAQHGMIADLWIDGTVRELVLVVIAAALVWFGLNRSLAPLARLSKEIDQRPPGTLDLVAVDEVHRELRPLVTALNQSLSRISGQIALQRRFIADAAHQLRTPLAVLKAQIFFGLSSGEPAEKDKSLAAASDSVTQLAHLTKQLLTLAKVEPDASAIVLEPVDLVAITRKVLEENADRALAKGMDLAFDVELDEARVKGSGTLLHELVANLVDNALLYVPAGGAIATRIERQRDMIILSIQDSGPGIQPAERERVFDRFYRILGSDAEGSGLGLSIVREIAARHGGAVTLSAPFSGSGLVVEVLLRAAQP